MKNLFTLIFTISMLASIDAQRTDNFDLVDAGNYKTAEPEGTDEAHWIEKETDITYTIYFQNNGSDTAYNLRVIDTLSTYLDVTSLREDEASHFFNLTIVEDNIVRFSFPNIHLPNRGTNEAASMGYVSFKVSQKENLPLNTVIRNTATAYFDFLPPIFTNEVFHTIGEGFTNTDWVYGNAVTVKVMPNPFADKAVVNVNGATFKEGSLEVFNTNGQMLRSMQFAHPRFDFQSDGLPTGQLFYKISLDGLVASTGVFVVK